MKEMVQIREEEGQLLVTLRLSNRWEIWRLSVVLAAGAKRPDCTPKEAGRWRRAVRELTRLRKQMEPPLPPPKRKRRIRKKVAPSLTSRVRRPPSDMPDPDARKRVIDGIPPYPVLCVSDLRMVWPVLEAKGLSRSDIADRLHVTERSVFRWRREQRLKESDSAT